MLLPVPLIFEKLKVFALAPTAVSVTRLPFPVVAFDALKVVILSASDATNEVVPTRFEIFRISTFDKTGILAPDISIAVEAILRLKVSIPAPVLNVSNAFNVEPAPAFTVVPKIVWSEEMFGTKSTPVVSVFGLF